MWESKLKVYWLLFKSNCKEFAMDTREMFEEMAETPRARRHQQRLRRLIIGDDIYEPPQSQPTTNQLPWRTLALTIIVLAMLVNFCANNGFDGSGALKNFIGSYRKHYHQIVHGNEKYCDHEINVQTIFTNIRKIDILHQEQPLGLLQMAMRNKSNLNSIALVGASGVGKSMMAFALTKNFPWSDNVHTYSWSTYVPEESQKFYIISLMIASFSTCGRNLLVIDNLAPCDRDVVSIVNKMVLEADNAEKKRVTVIYIFQLNAMEHISVYYKQFEVLQKLPNTTVINFNMFDTEELKDCIHREAELSKVVLSKKNFDEIVRIIDPRRSGCKNVYAKVSMYGS